MNPKMGDTKYLVVSALDNIRWNTTRNSQVDMINFSHNNLTDDQKILTHWLSYITDRQMPYQIIWQVGGFVFSDLIKEYGSTSSKDLMKIDDPNSFVRSKTPKKVDDPTRYEFVSHEDANALIRDDYPQNINEVGKCRFASRFYPVDYVAICNTLAILEKDYNKSICEYICKIIEKVYAVNNGSVNGKAYIDAIAQGLNYLTYNIGTLKADKMSAAYDNLYQSNGIIRLTDNISTWISSGCTDNLNEGRFDSSKRLWCSLRDYIKSPIYSKYFINAINGILPTDIYQSFNKEVLKDAVGCKYIELPGDVWNENSKFRQCFDSITKGKFGKHLREDCYKPNSAWYPEQFDITFDLVPRMCDNNRCDACLFNEKTSLKEVEAYCHKTKDKMCPLVLLHCGFEHPCNGDGCELRKILKNR